MINNIYPTNHQAIRTVYIGNVPHNLSVNVILDQVKTGAIQAIRPLPEKNGLFITFVEHISAVQFFMEFNRNRNRFIIQGHELRIGWGKPSHLNTILQTALRNGASRNVYLGSLEDDVTEIDLKQELSRFGHIEHIKLLKDKRIAFVHFLCITNAIKCVNTLQTESRWQTKRVHFGKDRCAKNTTTYAPFGYSIPYDPYTSPPMYSSPPPPPLTTTVTPPVHHDLLLLSSTLNNRLGGIANRTIYLGNLHPDTTAEDICNVVRGGMLSHLKFIPEKHIAFITFVDPMLAEQFYHTTEYLVIKNRRLKLGWGKPSALTFQELYAVQNGGSRNVYIGNIDDSMTEEKLKHDFSEYGDIELVNALREKNCAFVNFTGIASAVRAIEGIRTKEEYKKFRINYGKDRCGNPSRFNNTTTTNNSSVHNDDDSLIPSTTLTTPTTTVLTPDDLIKYTS